MPEIEGVDTITGLASDPPMGIDLDRKVMVAQQKLMQAWNLMFIAIIPYCFKCKEPLVWHMAPREDDVVFHCSKCKRIWMMGKTPS